MPTGRRMAKDVIYIYNGILFSHENEWNDAICSNMDGPRDYHIKWGKSDREWQILCEMTYLWNLKRWYKWSYLENRNRLTDLEHKLMVTKEERREGHIN